MAQYHYSTPLGLHERGFSGRAKRVPGKSRVRREKAKPFHAFHATFLGATRAGVAVVAALVTLTVAVAVLAGAGDTPA